MVNYYHNGSRQELKEELKWMLDDWRWLMKKSSSSQKGTKISVWNSW